MKLQKLTYLSFLFVLQGCNDTDIDQVKSLVYGYDESITLGNVLDHREVCSDTQWREFKDNQRRDVVEYQCVLKGVNTYSIAQRTINTKALENSKSPYKSHLRIALSNDDNYLSQQEKSRTISWANDALQKIDSEISLMNEKPLASKIIQVIQWGVTNKNKPELIDIVYNVELDNKDHKTFHAKSTEQLEFELKQTYDQQITSYTQMVNIGHLLGGVPRWPF